MQTYDAAMRKLTLLLDDDIVEGLHRVAGRGQIGRFVAEKVRPYLVQKPTGTAGAAFGLLAHLAKPVTPGQEADAKRAYLAARGQRKRRP
jgi:hypothetical protein